MKDLVFIDLETTGLDLAFDEIIEVGIVIVEDFEIKKRISFFVHPTIPLPESISEITGISNQMLAHAPKFTEMLPEIHAILENRILVGHSIEVDIGFLDKHGMKIDNPSLDTYELSQILLPTQKRYSLKALGNALGIEEKNTHRALDDASLTYRVFECLRHIALDIPENELSLITNLAIASKHKTTLFWELVYGSKNKQLPLRGNVQDFIINVSRRIRAKSAESTEFVEVNRMSPELVDQPLDPRYNYLNLSAGMNLVELDNLFHQQRQLVELIAESTVPSEKSLVLSFPDNDSMNLAIAWLSSNSKICGHMAEFHQRSSYICLRRLEFLLSLHPRDKALAQFLSRVVVWLLKSSNLNLDQMSFSRYAHNFSNEVACQENVCANACESYIDCPLVEHNRSVKKKKVIVTLNKDLLSLSDLRINGDQYRMIISESWTLSENWLNVFHGYYNLRSFLVLTDRLYSYLGTVDTVNSLGLDNGKDLSGSFSETRKQLANLVSEISNFYDLLGLALLLTKKNINYDFTQQHLRILDNTRRKAAFQEVTEKWVQVRLIIEKFIDYLKPLVDILLESYPATIVGQEVRTVAEDIDKHKALFDTLLLSSKLDDFWWADVQTDGNGISILNLPASLASNFSELFSFTEDILFLSPALLVDKSDGYVRRKLNIEDSKEIAVTNFSRKDWSSEVLFYWTPNFPQYEDANKMKYILVSNFVTLSEHIKRPTIIMFGSTNLMFSVYRKLSHQLEQLGHKITIADQENFQEVVTDVQNNIPVIVLCTFHQLPKLNSLLGLFPVVIITKLPFPDMSHPNSVFFSNHHQDPFHEYSLPEAARTLRYSLKFLSHNLGSKGSCLILDPRISSVEFGKYFLRDLPLCHIESGNFLHFIKSSLDWFSKDEKSTNI